MPLSERKTPFALSLFLLAASASNGRAAEPARMLHDGLVHLRVDGPREWTAFPETPDGPHLALRFEAKRNADAWTLRLRQQDVKQTWDVSLGAKRLGRLPQDENDMVVYFDIPAAALTTGENTLRIAQRGAVADDIRVGEIAIHPTARRAVLSEAHVEVDVVDADTGRHLPARITILDARGALQSVGATSDDHLAVRPGIVYTADGKARFGVPAGAYTLRAGRGFEYSLASERVQVDAGASVRATLAIRREVPTQGYVACDTHIHTRSHSGHGDATVEERMITIAAEGIELPIATDHNVHIDHDPYARKMQVRQHFTPVIGNEVTTRVGHFNIFPVRAGSRVPDTKSTDWKMILNGVYATPGVRVAILNHARDLHGDTRPFGPKLHNAVVGENRLSPDFRPQGMEVINSGATQTDVLQLFHDWMGLLNRGRNVTPVGASDSHDVGRHFVGQGRTYIRCDDRDPGNIDVQEAVDSFLAGRVMVSYGLLAELTVDGEYGSGTLAPVRGDEVNVAVRVLGPHWTKATRVMLYANGKKIREAVIRDAPSGTLPAGVRWAGQWSVPKPRHDVHLVAIAVGPGIDGLHWKTAKAYQPASPEWEAHVVGCSGAVWLDADGDGRKTAAYDYARRLVDASDGDLAALVKTLAPFDEAVAAQAAHLYVQRGGSLRTLESKAALEPATSATRTGVRSFLDARRKSQIARRESER